MNQFGEPTPNVLDKKDFALAIAVIVGSVATFVGSIVLSNRVMKKQLAIFNDGSESFPR